MRRLARGARAAHSARCGVRCSARSGRGRGAAPAWRLDVQAEHDRGARRDAHLRRADDERRRRRHRPRRTTPLTFSGNAAGDGTDHASEAPTSGWDCSSARRRRASVHLPEHDAPCSRRRASASLTRRRGGRERRGGRRHEQLHGRGGDRVEPSASTVDPTTITDAPLPFGDRRVRRHGQRRRCRHAVHAGGGHPFAATVSIDFNTLTDPAPLKGRLWPVEPVKDISSTCRRGSSATRPRTERCTAVQLASDGIVVRAMCPSASQVGTAIVRLNGAPTRSIFGPLPVYNLVPGPGVPARFGFNVAGTVVTLDAELRSATDYGLSVRVRNVPQALAIAGTSLTFWGVPADDVHDAGARLCGSIGAVGGRADVRDRRRAPRVPAQPDVVHRAGRGAAGVAADGLVGETGRVHGRDVRQPPAARLPAAAGRVGAGAGRRPAATRCRSSPALSVAPAAGSAGAPSGFTIRRDAAAERGPGRDRPVRPAARGRAAAAGRARESVGGGRAGGLLAGAGGVGFG